MSRIPVAPLVKFLVFALVTALATTVLASTIANSQGGERTAYSARFTDASGLLAGDDVRIAGVVVGTVDSVEIVDRRFAHVGFSVDSAQRLPGSVTAAVLYKNLIGQRFLSLDRGDGHNPVPLPPGGEIPVQRTTPPLDLTTLFNGFQPLFAALDPEQVNTLSMEIVEVLQGQGGTVDSLLSSTASLTSTIADRDQVIGQVIDNLNAVLQTVSDNDQQLDDLIVSLRELVSGLAGDREPIGAAIASLGDLTTTTAGLLEEGRPALKQDIASLGDLSGRLNQAEPTIEHFLQFAPYKLNKLGRAASYGSWFQFYLCGLSGSVGIGGLVPAQELPVFASDAPRCGPDPSGSGGESPPLLPAPSNLPIPTQVPDLPVLGGGGR
ncbi:ABC transporter substrate-binding protein [Pseudonocardia sulfidoxydans NBRC 16205]|uniref:ABC transporter substrate-binding protein n=1 Tax=Pseudonocardia sulfidoxydans NBRC 16205 TaxID=1223511 RepID=A0A511DGA2_9PSEU|nr:MCE family protein [Pseudonocardia sulfidoxydans]GEL22028.1 ABC transporter substrate-binding protein [Pseudonocardia sulfidoxydans NBRC 16205]